MSVSQSVARGATRSVATVTAERVPVRTKGQSQTSADQRLLFRKSDRTARLTGVGIRSVGAYVPERTVTNAQLEAEFGFEPGWIERRSGIRERRYAADDEGTSDLAVKAARQAIEKAGVCSSEVDLVVVGTFTPDYTCPSTACLVQQKLDLDAPAMDIHAACSGFMYALVTGAQFIANGTSRNALVIGADVNSRIVEPGDRGTAPLFGDGAGCGAAGKRQQRPGVFVLPIGSRRRWCRSAGSTSGRNQQTSDSRTTGVRPALPEDGWPKCF